MSQRSLVSLFLILASFAACSKRQQERARDRAHEAERKVDEAGRKLKHQADRLADRATSGGGALRPDSGRAEEKLRNAGQTTRAAAEKTKAEAARLALVARAKAALANQVGLKTLSGVSVDSDGSTITLSGRVPRAEDKARAQGAVSSLSGVTRVVNHIEVE
jgi:osmotically-inducible protein OsmY